MLSFPFNTACLCGVGSDGRKKNKVIHDLLPRRQLQHKRCLRKQNNLFVWPQLCELWPVLIFRGGYVWHFCPQVELNVEKKKKNTMQLYIFLISLQITWKPLVYVSNFSLLNSRVYISCFAKVTRIFMKFHLSWGLGCSRVSATVRKQAEGMWKHEAIWLLVHFHTGSRGHWEPSKSCWDPAPAGNIWSHPSSARTRVRRSEDCLQTGQSLREDLHQEIWKDVLGNWFQSPCCLVTKSCPTLCNPMNHSTPVFPVLHHLPEFAQIHIHWVGDAM